MEINKKLVLIVNILIGILIVGFIFYRRFLVIRLPKNLWCIFIDYINYYLLLTIIVSIIFSSYQIITNGYYLIKKNSIKSYFILKINQFIANAIFELYAVICDYIPDVYEKVSTLAENFYALFHKYGEYYLLFVIFAIRFIILITFLTDIFICFKFNYFYKALYLLCISLLINLIIYIIRDFTNNLDQAESYLIIDDQGIDIASQLPITDFRLKDEFKDLNLDFYVKQYILCSKLSGYFNMYDKYSSFFTPYFNVMLYSLYCIGWTYIFITNLQAFIY